MHSSSCPNTLTACGIGASQNSGCAVVLQQAGWPNVGKNWHVLHKLVCPYEQRQSSKEWMLALDIQGLCAKCYASGSPSV